jgi:hypothetical protein
MHPTSHSRRRCACRASRSRGGGQVVEIEVAGTPLTRLYLSYSTEQSTGRGEIYGGAGHMREADSALADPRATISINQRTTSRSPASGWHRPRRQL